MNAESILNAINLAANTSLALNFAMHMLVLGTLLTLFFVANSKAKRYVFDGALLILAISVVVICIVNGNPFNLVTFAIVTVFSAIELQRGKNCVSKPRMSFNSIASFVFILIGLVYPEFVKANAALLPFVSPLGALPCPTFLVILGMLNLLIPNVNRVQFAATTVLGLFYGVTGVFQLGVYLDIALLVLVLYSFYNFRFIFGRKKMRIVHEVLACPQSISGEIERMR